jgi:hypothetical protein
MDRWMRGWLSLDARNGAATAHKRYVLSFLSLWQGNDSTIIEFLGQGRELFIYFAQCTFALSPWKESDIIPELPYLNTFRPNCSPRDGFQAIGVMFQRFIVPITCTQRKSSAGLELANICEYIHAHKRSIRRPRFLGPSFESHLWRG